jgi:hypothetical protein
MRKKSIKIKSNIKSKPQKTNSHKPKLTKSKPESAKIHSHLSKDINRIRRTAEAQTRMNILRKHQIRLLNDFLRKLLKEKKITKEELRPYMPKRKDAEKILFGKNKK